MTVNNSSNINSTTPNTVNAGGTGLNTATTAYGVVCAGTTATGAFQVLNSLGAAGTVLTSNGPGLLPSMQAVAGGSPNANLLYNGNFQVWQRGAGGAATFTTNNSDGYTADRWQFLNTASGNVVISQQAAKSALAGHYGMRIQRQAGASFTGSMYVDQGLIISDSLGAAGNTVTVTFQAWCGADFSAGGGSDTAITILYGVSATEQGLYQWTGSGGAQSTQNIAVTTALQTYTLSFAIPSTATQVGCLLQVIRWVGTAGANDWIQIDNVKLEISSSATAIVQESFNSTLTKCLPFYKKSFAYGTKPVQNAGLATGESTIICTIPSNVSQNAPSVTYAPMWTAPTLTFYSPAAASAQAYDESLPGACTNTTAYNLSAKSFAYAFTGNAAGQIGDNIGVHYTLESEL